MDDDILQRLRKFKTEDPERLTETFKSDTKKNVTKVLNSGKQEDTEDKGLFKGGIKLGTMDPTILITDKAGERISRSLVDIHIELEEGMIELAAENILLLERAPDDTLTITEVERQLSTISAYRFAFIRATAIIGKQIKQNRRGLNKWLAGERRNILKEVGDFRNRLKENESFTASWFGSITKDEIGERLELNETYNQMITEIEELEQQHETLEGLQDTMFQHSSNLRRLYERLNFEKSKT